MYKFFENGHALSTKSIINTKEELPTPENVNFYEIYVVNDIYLFGHFAIENRDVIPHNVSKLMKSYNKFGCFILNCLVDINTYNIVDGQNRIATLQYIHEENPDIPVSIDVRFINMPEDENERTSIIKECQTSTPWTGKTFEQVLLKQNYDPMVKVEEFGKTHSLTQRKNKKGEVTGYNSSYAFAIIFGRKMSKDIKEGNIPLNNNTLKRAEEVHEELRNIVMACGMTVGAWFESFAWAWNEIRDTSSDKRLIKQLTLPVIYENINDYLIIPGKTTNKQEWCRCIRTAIGDMANEILQPVY